MGSLPQARCFVLIAAGMLALSCGGGRDVDGDTPAAPVAPAPVPSIPIPPLDVPPTPHPPVRGPAGLDPAGHVRLRARPRRHGRGLRRRHAGLRRRRQRGGGPRDRGAARPLPRPRHHLARAERGGGPRRGDPHPPGAGLLRGLGPHRPAGPQQQRVQRALRPVRRARLPAHGSRGRVRSTCHPASFPLTAAERIDSVRVGFYGIQCPAGRDEAAQQLRAAAGGLPRPRDRHAQGQVLQRRGRPRPRPVHHLGAAAAPRVRGHARRREHALQQVAAGPGNGYFALCATVQGQRGCLEGEVTEN